MEEVFVKNIKTEIEDCNIDTFVESKSCLGLLDCGPIPYSNSPDHRPQCSLLKATSTKIEANEIHHITVKDEPPEESEMLVVVPDTFKGKPKKTARSSELRLIRKNVITELKKPSSHSTATLPANSTSQKVPPRLQSSQQKASLKEKVSCVSSLAQQLQEVSSQKAAMPCPYCNYSTSSEGNLKKHVASHKESNMELYSCRVCPFTTIYKYQLKTHTDRHSLEFGKHLCRFCNFSTADAEDLEDHLKTHQTCELLVCNYCGYKSTHKASFNKHIRKHGRPCPVCSYITFDKADMERHCESHLTVGTQAPLKPKEERTESLQTNDIEFVCCGEDATSLKLPSTAAAAGNHNTANWVQANAFPAKNRYLCMLCNYSCKYKFSLKQHMITHTGVGKLPCPYCKHESGNRSNLRKHVSAKHPGRTLGTRLPMQGGRKGAEL